MDWDKLRIFHSVAEAGSFTHAGDTLNLSQSAVSRQISALEDSLRTPLFHRHARGLILTEQGELLYRTVRDVFLKLAAAEAQISESKEKPSGLLRVTTPVALGSVWLTPRLKEFVELYPDIHLNLLVDDSELDLGMREADCAIRTTTPRQPDLVQRHLLTIHVHVFASPAYLKKFGVPKTAADLDGHKIIVYGEDPRPPFPGVNWLLEAGTKPGHRRQPALMVNNIYAILRAVENGIGIAAFPDYMAHESTKIVQVLPELEGPTYEAYFVYPEELRNSKRIAVFR
ncbi:MAG TPA: LysR family transcriptional regulator, partial [Alphaproteobacteria bacterium]|nr:LysR family transcriptional regulator [Alphaproteobacteria bacterium]